MQHAVSTFGKDTDFRAAWSGEWVQYTAHNVPMSPATHNKGNLLPVRVVGEFLRPHGGDSPQGSAIDRDTNPNNAWFSPGSG